MCGIVGYIGFQDATPILLEGLKKLEYRGYDSAGIAVLQNDQMHVVRSQGKLDQLVGKIKENPVQGLIGIGHTRWATHGRPFEHNAHPHVSKHVVLVHNGIIENYEELKKDLIEEGVSFSSETDTEVIPWLIDSYLNKEDDLEKALFSALTHLKGAFALALFSKKDPSTLYVAKNASPLIIGIGEGETFLASDIPALLPYTQKVIILEDGQVAKIKKDQVVITDFDNQIIEVVPKTIHWSVVDAQKEGYRHFMLKEIFEQPRAIANTLSERLSETEMDVTLDGFQNASFLDSIDQVTLLACGTSFHAALVAKYWLESYVHIQASVEIASEYRYRNPIVKDNTLTIAISQSGETADTLAALKLAKEKGSKTLAVCNVMDSTIARMSDEVLYTFAGPEIGVASTKAFTTQLTVLALISLELAKKHKTLDADTYSEMAHSLTALPLIVEQTLHMNEGLKEVAKDFSHCSSFIYLGRGTSYPIALEGALKLKEISYIHAEGYMGGELKHGPIALIDEEMPVLALASQGDLKEKMKSNIEEVKARGGIILTVSEQDDDSLKSVSDIVIKIPNVHPWIAPIVQVIPLQLLSYYIATHRGCDVDQPRNLAKSVTVE